LTDGDLDYFSRIKVRLVCDFRAAEEQATAPSRLPAHDPPEVLSLSVRPVAGNDLRDLALSTGTEVADIVAAYRAVYRAYARDHQDQFRTFIARLMDAGSYPAVFHCMAGKDRTGFAAAMILSTLGVPTETIYEDYLLTNEHWKLRVSLPSSLTPEAQTAFRAARREYLDAAFEEIAESHGTVGAYVEDALGINEEARERLRAHLLE